MFGGKHKIYLYERGKDKAFCTNELGNRVVEPRPSASPAPHHSKGSWCWFCNKKQHTEEEWTSKRPRAAWRSRRCQLNHNKIKASAGKRSTYQSGTATQIDLAPTHSTLQKASYIGLDIIFIAEPRIFSITVNPPAY